MAKAINSLFGAVLVVSAFILSGCDPHPHENNTKTLNGIRINILAKVNNQLVPTTGEPILVKKSNGELFYISNWQMLMSHLALVKTNGDTVQLGDGYQWFNLFGGRTSFLYNNLPTGTYKGIVFMLGMDSLINHGDPNQWPANHPLNGNTTGLHWGWAGGYVFQALDGQFTTDSSSSVTKGFSYHTATDAFKRTFFMPLNFSIETTIKDAELNFNVEKFFESPNSIKIADLPISHSEGGTAEITLMKNLLENAQNVYTLVSVK